MAAAYSRSSNESVIATDNGYTPNWVWPVESVSAADTTSKALTAEKQADETPTLTDTGTDAALAASRSNADTATATSDGFLPNLLWPGDTATVADTGTDIALTAERRSDEGVTAEDNGYTPNWIWPVEGVTATDHGYVANWVYLASTPSADDSADAALVAERASDEAATATDSHSYRLYVQGHISRRLTELVTASDAAEVKPNQVTNADVVDATDAASRATSTQRSEDDTATATATADALLLVELTNNDTATLADTGTKRTVGSARRSDEAVTATDTFKDNFLWFDEVAVAEDGQEVSVGWQRSHDDGVSVVDSMAATTPWLVPDIITIRNISPYSILLDVTDNSTKGWFILGFVAKTLQPGEEIIVPLTSWEEIAVAIKARWAAMVRANLLKVSLTQFGGTLEKVLTDAEIITLQPLTNVGPIAVMQAINAGSDFDGTWPTGTMSKIGDDVFSFAPGTAGGLFDPTQFKPLFGSKLQVSGIEIEFGGQISWTVSRVDLLGNEVVYLAGTTESDLVITPEAGIIMLSGEKLKLETTGASTAMKAEFKFDPM